MRRLPTASALLALALFATAALGQPQPGGLPAKLDPPAKMPEKKADKKVPDPTDAAIAAALVNDPDVKMARAKIQLAEAELAKARAAVTLRVVTLRTKIAQHKTEVASAQESVALVTRQVQAGSAPTSNLVAVRASLEAAQGALALAEAELKLLTGGADATAGVTFTAPTSADHTAQALAWLLTHQPEPGGTNASVLTMLGAERWRERAAVQGPVPDRLRAALDKPVKLGAKGDKFTFEKALEVFKTEAGLDVPVRGKLPPVGVESPKNPNEIVSGPIEIVSEGETLPVGAWFQLFEDRAVVYGPTGSATKFQFYVREYGVLVADKGSAPEGAPTLTEFWKQKPPAKEPQPQPKVESEPKKK